ncbi:hypothetical protein BCV69DRAFT_253399 [Microstroma glucosiphilum]|uniref:Prokaryotic-type class I peptide chain release factors domain-containing protein n=1 Tax=Pseudomicrostroma glucosiphilum TaxID=1684307 RepID=A0A316TYL9_9BASI|nr:hypothetical protein BCV69DRAFT_253399 [Pseudomicrostroma glucosiphilum]PWN18150.1 hypothetical protein BCV69DRAFT_253399 [Pseudomicrostroma glucosiphilum]
MHKLNSHPGSAPDGESESESEEPRSQQVRRAWSQALASRRAQWSQPSAKGGGTGGGGSSRSALPKEIFDVSFSRSQGPGGQNVNKVNTKANVRLLLAAASSPSIFDSGKSPLPVPIPREVVSRLVEKSTYYTQASHSLLVSSESLRTQEGNLSDAIEKLLDHLHQHATADLINPTPLLQKEKVQRLIAREKGKLKKVKSQRSAVKSGRRDKGF